MFFNGGITMLRLRPAVLLNALAALCLLQSAALAQVTVYILSPGNGAVVYPGESFTVTAQAQSTSYFMASMRFSFNGQNIYYYYGQYTLVSPAIESETFTVPANAAPGTTYQVSVRATSWGDFLAGVESIRVIVGAADTTPPGWGSNLASGIKSVERPTHATANVTWYPATDDRTAADKIVYQIYYDPVQAKVFTSGVKASVTGALAMTVTGLDARTNYYVGVRAADSKGNADTNTKTLQTGLAKNRVDARAWAAYE